MSDIAAIGGRDLAAFVPPGDRGQRVAALEAAAKHAAKIGDLERFRAATEEKLAQQAGAASDYVSLFPHGVHNEMPDTGISLREDWCKELGSSIRTVVRWKALIDETARAERAGALVTRMQKLLAGDEAANFSSETNEWYTPARYVDAVRELFGGAIDLDPATCEQANETVQAAQIFTIDDDALRQAWHGSVFLNPPYGMDKGDSVAGRFCRKAIAEHIDGNVDRCVILVNSSHSQKWQAPLYRWPVCFVDHRIAFVNGGGQSNENPTFQNVFVYLGANVDEFARIFGGFGYVMVPAT